MPKSCNAHFLFDPSKPGWAGNIVHGLKSCSQLSYENLPTATPIFVTQLQASSLSNAWYKEYFRVWVRIGYRVAHFLAFSASRGVFDTCPQPLLLLSFRCVLKALNSKSSYAKVWISVYHYQQLPHVSETRQPKKSRIKLVVAQNKPSHLKGSCSGNVHSEDIGKRKI